MNYKLIVDENIENATDAFGNIGETILQPGRAINNEILRDTDFLIVRSITKVNESLLNGTKVKFVGTATIGTDHIDQEYLKEKGIGFTSAKGCNSDAVVEYVFISIFRAAVEKKISLKGKSVGIIGCGNIGSRVARVARAFGFSIVLNDPPLQRETNDTRFRTLEEALACDIVSFHTPLNRNGVDNTFHLLNESNLSLIKPNAILINASRGEVIDNRALLDFMNKRDDVTLILDVWENEPVFSPELLKRVFIASPHVAGYSLEGKMNGTKIVYDALCGWMKWKKEWIPDLPFVEEDEIQFLNSGSFEKEIDRVLTAKYRPQEDTSDMQKISLFEADRRGKAFDELRKNYPLRREFTNYKIRGVVPKGPVREGLKALGFRFLQDLF
ncbi:4-phosphoerythronate dehydrogenase PdxB [Ignavibacteriales bacterium]